MNLCRERENMSLRHTDLKVLNIFSKTIFPDDELTLTGIVSSKEGHDESHIDDMKIGT